MKGNVRVSRPPVVFIGRTGGTRHDVLWHLVGLNSVALCGAETTLRQAYTPGLAAFWQSMRHRCGTCRNLL